MPSPFRSAGFRWFVVAPVMFVVFVASALFVSFHLMRATTAPKRDKAVAELDAADPNWRTTALTAERNAKLPPPEQNSAELAYKVYEKLPKAYREWEYKSAAASWRSEVTNPHLPPKADMAETRAQLRKVREAVEIARRLKDVPGGGFAWEYKEPDIIGTSLDKHQNLRGVMSLLSYDAAVRAYDRDDTGSLDSCLAILSVARGIGDDPWLISQLIRMAGVAICVGALERTLCWGDGYDDARLAELEKAFAREADEPRLLYGLRGERAMFFRVSENIDSGAMGRDTAVELYGPPIGSPLVWYLRARMPDEQAVGLEMYNALIAAAAKPAGRERATALGRVESEFDNRTVRRRVGPVPLHPLLGLLMPAVYKIQESDTRTVASLNAARVAVACERHRARTGSYPETIDDISKELLPAVPTDPFSGNPVRYKKLPDGAMAYSVGGDGKDDGGAKLNPKTEKGNDLGFRLWTPEHRRKPAEPRGPSAVTAGSFFIFGDDKPKPGTPTAPEPLSPWVKTRE